MNARTIALAILAAVIAVSFAGFGSAGQLDPERFDEHVRALTADAHRLAGSPEGRAAGDYIEARLRELNGQFMAQRFTFPQEVVEICELETPSGVMPLFPMRANGMQPSVTGADGMTGRLVYVGSRRFAPSDLLDMAGFVRGMIDQAQSGEPAPGARIWELLGDDLRSDLEKGLADDDFPVELQQRLAHKINAEILGLADFYSEAAWRDIHLRHDARRMVRRVEYGLSSDELYRFNRLLIEDAFPRTIARGYDGKRIMDSIVLADLSDRADVSEYFRLGAQAVIFVNSDRDDPLVTAAGRSLVSLDMPRFYVSEETAAEYSLFTAGEVTLRSTVRWKKQSGRNLFLYIRGTDPVFKFDREEYLILSAHYDTGGLVPNNNPGYESAANCAALLEIARNLSENPPRRSVLITFFDNHHNYHDGSRRFYTALRRAIPDRLDDPLPVRQRFVEEERAFLREYQDFFQTEDIFNTRHRLRDRARHRLSEEARYRYNTYLENLTETRISRHRAQARINEIEEALEELQRQTPSDPDRIAELEDERAVHEAALQGLAGREDPLEAERRAWQSVRESIRDATAIPETDLLGIQRFNDTVQGVLTQIQNRMAELDEVAAHVDDAITITGPLSNANPIGHVSLNYSAGGNRWLFIPTNAQLHMRYYGSLIDDAQLRLRDDGNEDRVNFVWGARSTWEAGSASPDSFVNYNVDGDYVTAIAFEIPSMALVTEQTRAYWRGKPDARPSMDSLRNILKQAEEFEVFLASLADEGYSSVTNTLARSQNLHMEEYTWEGSYADGHQVMSFSYGDPEASKTEPHALVRFISADFQRDFYVYADGNGVFPWLTVANITPYSDWRRPQIEAARFDEHGKMSAISTAWPGGPVASVQNKWHRAGVWLPKAVTGHYTMLNTFSGEMGMVIGRYRPLAGPFKPGAFRLMEGLSDSNFPRMHFRFDAEFGAGVYYVERPLGVKVIYKDPQNPDDVALYINPKPGIERGVGYGPGSGYYFEDKPMRIDLRLEMAGDMSELNMSRLVRLRERNIILNYVEYLHSEARDLLGSFETAHAEDRHREAVIHAATIAGLERRIYNPVITTTQDMVKAVTVLLILAIPFAFSLQSLLLPSYNIYRKIAGFMIFFMFSFVLLYFTHPAFAFSATPIVIILAFIIMVMSALVIWVISGKFNYEIKKMQGLATAAHSFQRKLFGNLGAAVSLAISIMQRRPVRTALTVITVLLLTFTILSFVAFQPEQGINRFYRGPAEDQISRLMFRNRVWRTMDVSFDTWADFFETYYGHDFELHGRYWKTRELEVEMTMDDLYIPIRHESGTGAAAGAMMTFDEIEIRRLPEIERSILPGNVKQFLAGEGVYLSEALEEQLGVREGETISIEGVEVKYLGAFNSTALAAMRQIDGSPIVPISYGVSRLAIGQLQERGSAAGGADPMADIEEEMEQLEPEALEPVSPRSLVIVPAALAGKFNMLLKAIVVYPVAEEADLEGLAETITVLNYDGAYMNLGGERSRLYYGERYGMAGIADVLIPLILGGLIVFSTMLGSIIDREKEIYTFSALGLAPKNVAMLFFVEAAIYAVLGGFGGYLFSQAITSLVLEPLAQRGIFAVPEMNYSSSTVINTILVVMATVIISTIYPAIKAARRATADTMSHWHLPSPKGDTLEFNFPFTISRYDITGIICFIREHFANHADRTVGKFAADHVEIAREAEHGFTMLSATVWLQPFDQGISQIFELSASPSEIEEVCEITIRLKRLSGPPSAWKRSYRVFLGDLRSQFLLWRTLTDEARDHYLTVAEDIEASIDDRGAVAAQAEESSVL